ncbi:hypothetical protein CAEBREN_09304 [Caenorhabditis brenneri]|uniref:Uncharacterized protein n=1 Tax=Caenorhabditis brenneri TaxID=135651 RepID=G0N681_CAEBE|nr:hypothetical protein CAEBREN_09304 [Caenorhabditis brenneri]
MKGIKEIFQTPSNQSAVSSDVKPDWAGSDVPQRPSNILAASLGWGHSTESGKMLEKDRVDMKRIAMKKESDQQEGKNVMKGWMRQAEEQDEEFYLEVEAYQIERRRLYELKHESDFTERHKVVDQKKIQSSVHPNESDISKSHQSLCLTEEIIKQITASKIRLQSERKSKKKQKHSAEELFRSERCLKKLRTECLKDLKHRYKTWKEENSTENQAAVLFHFMKIENELNHFEKRTIQKYLGDEEVDDTEKGEKDELKTEKRWKKCDKNLDYHKKNQQESIEEAVTLSESFDSILRSDEELIALINELTELERRMTAEWGPIQRKLFLYVNSLRHILNEEEKKVAECVLDFQRLRDDALQRKRELMRDLEQFGDAEAPDHVLDRKNEIIATFERASVKLAETNLMHRRLTILPEDFSLEISQTLLARISDLQEVSSDILGKMQDPNNDHNLLAPTKTWRDKIGKTWEALTDIRLLIPTIRLQQNKLEQLNALLTRVKRLHCPPWFDPFLDAVGGNVIEEILQFRDNIGEYNAGIVEIYKEIEQFLMD